jgi:hypothetical protein
VSGALAPLALAAALALSSLPAAAQSPTQSQKPASLPASPPGSQADRVSPPAGATAASGSGSGDEGSFTVYLPPTRSAPPARSASRRPVPPGEESGLAVAIAAAVFAAAGLAWLGLRSPACPRCRQKLVRLERSSAEAATGAGGDAVRPIEELIDGTRRDPWACLACGVVMRRRFGPFVAADDACPSCGSPTKKTRLTVVERPGYLTWGEVRLDEDCLTCSHRTSALYAAPPLEVPIAQRGTAQSARGATSRSSR